ncbi:MAG: uroporphyrinogen decarboxylase family protein, partial [Lysobacterales bacterium]
MIEPPKFPAGLHLLSRWQSGDPDAKNDLNTIFDAAIAGHYDADFAVPAPADTVHVSASVHMIALGILHDLYGIESAEYYKTDPERYARANLMVSRLLGVNKLYMTWALYAFTCEAIGQVMMYPDKFPPGSDPDHVLITRDTWQSLATPDFTTGVPKIINDVLRVTERLTGMEPLLQISAPYSLAADIYGQEPLLASVVQEPDFVNALLDHLADQILAPWTDHFISEFPNGWIELSDASGSPFFIGPDNCINMAIRSIKHMMDGKPWAERVFDANYRGDFVTQARKKDRSSRRRKAGAGTADSIHLSQLTDLKHSVCRDFIIRLEADKVPLAFYQEQAIARGVPLTTGIGSSQVDRNSIPDLDFAKQEIRETAREFVAAIKNVCETIDLPADNHVLQPWPSHVYFEDISSQSQF